MRIITLSATVLATALAGPAFATTITLNNFATTQDLTLSGSATQATTSAGQVLRLASAVPSQAGNVFSTQTINASNFSTEFQFQMNSPGGVRDTAGLQGGDGLTFIVQSVSGAGTGAGYDGIPQSVGIKFDTFMNGVNWGNNDPSSNFLGIYTNGNIQTTSATPTANVPTPFDNGQVWTAWIDYNGTTLTVDATDTGVRDATPLISDTINIPSLLGQGTAYVGFGASTGAAWENDYILNWTYNDNYSPIGNVPEPASMAILGTGLMMLHFGRKRITRPAAI
jgi:hypothetical protein